MCSARRVYARTVDEWLIGTLQVCGTCKEAHDELVAERDELRANCADESELREAEAAVKAATYSYRSYNPRSIQLYAQRYYWYVAGLPYVVLNKRTAITRELARQIMIPGSNPTDLSKQLLEFKTEWFDLLRAQVIGMHAWSKERRSGQQLTLEQLCMPAYENVTHESVALCAPGHALIRHFYLAVSDAEASYKFSWRQQNVGVTVAAVDASLKRGKALELLKVRQTVWSNDVQAPLVSVFVSSASLDDSGFSAACKDYNAVVTRVGMQPMQLLYLDCTFRDGPGAIRRFPQLAQAIAGSEIDYASDGGSPALIDTVAACDAWVALFDGDSTVEMGLDIEYRAAQGRGCSPGKAATLQLVSLRRGGREQLTAAVFSLTRLGVLPPSLLRLLGRARLAGVKIGTDIAKLESDRLSSPGPSSLAANISELSTLAHDKLRLSAGQLGSLKAVFERCCPGDCVTSASRYCHVTASSANYSRHERSLIHSNLSALPARSSIEQGLDQRTHRQLGDVAAAAPRAALRNQRRLRRCPRFPPPSPP